MRNTFLLFIYFRFLEFIHSRLFTLTKPFDLKNYLYSIALSFLLCAALVWFSSLKKLTALAMSFLIVGVSVSSTELFKYFGEYLSASMLKFMIDTKGYFIDLLRSYLGWGGFVFFTGIVGALAVVLWLFRANSRVSKKMVLVWIGLSLFLFSHTWRRTERFLALDTQFLLGTLRYLFLPNATKPLLKTPHLNPNELPVSRLNYYPQTIVVVIHESLSYKALFKDAHTHEFTGLLPKLSEKLNTEFVNRTIFFSNAFTNSSATDVSMPSIFTGVSPEEPYSKLHFEPFIWDYAGAKGYKTYYFSSQKISFGHFKSFLSGSSYIDGLGGAEELTLPIVNDLGGDDNAMLSKVLKKIDSEATSQPLFLVLNTNAAHAPFQCEKNESKYASRYECACSQLDDFMMSVLNWLDISGRSDGAFIWMTADHGDFPTYFHKVPRISSFYDEILRIPMLMILPKSKPISEELLKNSDKNVQNIDIAPTLASLFGFQNSKLKGADIFKKIPEKRTIVALNTNESRMWTSEGFALIQDNYRLVFSNIEDLACFQTNVDPNQFKRLSPAMCPFRIQNLPSLLQRVIDRSK